MRRTMPVALAVIPLLALSCGGNDASDGGAGTDSAGSGLTHQTDSDPLKLDVFGTDAVEGGEDCAEVIESAMNSKQPADIIFVVDNSGSMDFETAAVQANMNSFSMQIEDSGIDYHVVLLSAYPGDGGDGDNGICIDPPLGGGGCVEQDDNPPRFLHIDQEIDSNNGLEQLIDHHPDWASAIRPDSVKHIVIVTDDNSDLDAADFDAEFKQLDPSYDPYIFHGIICFYECPEAAEIGEVYVELIDQTDGVQGDLCLQDFQSVFDEVATAVIGGVSLSCEWEIPSTPDGEEFDPDAVNVEFDDGIGGTLDIGRVDSPAECANVTDGWYYDDPVSPTMILVCPQTCDKIQGFQDAKINIKFGCETTPAG